MKELKFRCYSKKYEVMEYCDTIKDLYDVTHNNKDDSLIEIRQIEIMQYTWLKDKNWKEIYEGDILKIWKSTKDYYVVFWHDRYCCFAIKSKWDLYSHFFWEALEPEDCEVIWNIYENPELLNNDK